MTKKQYKALMRKNRSVVTKGQNTGTVSHRSKRDYNRQAEKAKLKEATRDVSLPFFVRLTGVWHIFLFSQHRFLSFLKTSF